MKDADEWTQSRWRIEGKEDKLDIVKADAPN